MRGQRATRELIEDDFDKLSQAAVTIFILKVWSANTYFPCVRRLPASILVVSSRLHGRIMLKADRRTPLPCYSVYIRCHSRTNSPLNASILGIVLFETPHPRSDRGVRVLLHTTYSKICECIALLVAECSASIAALRFNAVCCNSLQITEQPSPVNVV